MTHRPQCNHNNRIGSDSTRPVPRTLRRPGRTSVMADLAAHAEARGWDAIFLWDRIHYPPRNRPVADVWVVLSAIAMATQSIRLGPMVTRSREDASRKWHENPSPLTV